MEIQKDKNGIIFVNGSVTSDNAEAFREDLLTYAQGRELVLDCLGLSYISRGDRGRSFVSFLSAGVQEASLNGDSCSSCYNSFRNYR